VLLGLAAHAAAPYAIMTLAMLVAGTGTGILNPETARAMQAQASPQRAGMASGIGATIRFVSLVLGVAVLGAVFHAGFAASAFVAVGIALLAAVGTAVLLGQEGWVQEERSREDSHGTQRSWTPAPHRS
jgi:hypothetical protein